MTTRPTPTLTGPWHLTLPPGWASFPTDPATARPAVKRAVEQRMQGAHRDELVHHRIDLERRLLDVIEQAREQGASSVHSLLDPIQGMAVSATLVVVELTLLDSDGLLTEMERVFGAAEGVLEHGTVQAAGMDGVRRLRRKRELDLEAEANDPDARFHSTHLDYILAAGPDDYLLLHFTTLTDELADELVLLFDVMADSLHRRSPRKR